MLGGSSCFNSCVSKLRSCVTQTSRAKQTVVLNRMMLIILDVTGQRGSEQCKAASVGGSFHRLCLVTGGEYY